MDDARLALNCLELMVDMAPEQKTVKKLDRTLLKEVLGERQARFDKQGDRFYDLISACINPFEAQQLMLHFIGMHELSLQGAILFMLHDVY